MSEKSKRRAAKRIATAAARQAARPAETAQPPAATAKAKPKKKGTKIVWTKEQKAKIVPLTKANLEKHNFKYYPRRKEFDFLPTQSSVWALETVPLPFMQSPPPSPTTRPYPEEPFRLQQPTVVGR